jgi:hypothetical protein
VIDSHLIHYGTSVSITYQTIKTLLIKYLYIKSIKNTVRLRNRERSVMIQLELEVRGWRLEIEDCLRKQIRGWRLEIGGSNQPPISNL